MSIKEELLTIIAIILFFFIVLIGIWWVLQFPASIKYSEGQRVGLLSKFSYRGVIIKNWCGEMVVGTQKDLFNPEVYTLYFGIDRKKNDKVLIEKIQKLVGKEVIMEYEQKLFNHPLLGCSDYLVSDIKEYKK